MIRPPTLLAAALGAIALFGMAATPAHAQIYVDTDATGDGDGTSWTDAYTDLQTAIDNASSSDEIWIAEGVYTPDPDGTDQSLSFTITGAQDGLEIYGGFEGVAAETARSDRNPSDHPVVLSGDIDGNDVTNADGVTETVGDIDGSNSFHVLFLDGTSTPITTATHIDGVTVTGGQAGDGDESGESVEDGGGLYCNGEGGRCNPTLRQMTFRGNTAERWGGAIYNNGTDGTSSPTITNAGFIGNSASRGGAIFNNGTDGTSSPTITNTVFISNSATSDGGAIYNEGFGTSSPTITNAVFTGNSADSNGGAIHNNGTEGTTSPQITNTILWSNSASSSDEIYNSSAAPTLAHTLIEGGCPSGATCSDLITSAPQFVAPDDPEGADDTFATVDDGLAVGAGSPALDAGDNAAIPSGVSEDITGADRIQDQDGDGTATVNVGAYELRGLGPPVASTGSASNVGGTTADLSGAVNPSRLQTTVRAEYFPTSAPSDVQTVTASASPLTGGATQNVTVSLSGLTPNTEYRARVLANNSEGVAEGDLVTFTTGAGYTRTISGTDGTGNDAGWRMLALPAQGKTRAALEDDLTFATNSGSILYRWTSGSWSPLENSSDALPRGTGFMLYFFDDVIDPIDAEGLPLAISTGGEDQSQNVTVDALSTGETFHLVGNPFDVAFDLSELNLSEQGFQQTVQVWDPSAGGGTGDYIQVTQGDVDDEIAAWQGFFVERDPNADTDGQTLTFSTAGKQDSGGDLIGSQSAALADAKASDENRLRLDLRLAAIDTTGSDTSPPSPSAQLSLTRPSAALDTIEGETTKTQAAAQNSSEADTIATGRLGLLFSEDGTAGWDEAEATQVSPPGGGPAAVTLSSPLTRDGSEENVLVRRALASEPYPTEEAAVTLPVAATVPEGSYAAGAEARLGFSEVRREELSRQLPSGWALRLTDTETGESTDLLSETYSFTLEEGVGTGLQSPSEARFRLAVGPQEVLPVEGGLTLEAPYPNPATQQTTVEYAVPPDKADSAQILLYDVLGRRVRTVAVKGGGPRTRQLDVSGLASGVYVLRLTAEGMQQTRKLTVVR